MIDIPQLYALIAFALIPFLQIARPGRRVD